MKEHMYYDLKSGRLLAIGQESEVSNIADNQFYNWASQLSTIAQTKGIDTRNAIVINNRNDIDNKVVV